MAVLEGEQIESHLWNYGLDFEHRNYNDQNVLWVYVGDCVIWVSETWAEDDEWFLDTDTLNIFINCDGEDESCDQEVSTELELVRKITSLGLISEE